MISCGANTKKWQKTNAVDERFVTVDLTDYYHGRGVNMGMGDGFKIAPGELPEADTYMTIQDIPFYISKRKIGDNLDVGLARWPDMEKDPAGFYSHYKPKFDGDPECPVIHIPKENYASVYLLCIADTSQNKTPIVSFRLGLFDGNGRLFDSSVRVPRWNEAANDNTVAKKKVALLDASGKKTQGQIFVIRAPLCSGDTQEILGTDHLDLELTKELHIAVHQPDPNRFRIRALGWPSAVHVFALTLEKSPIQMMVKSKEVGNIFIQPQEPVFKIDLRNITEETQKFQIEAVVTDYYGKQKSKWINRKFGSLEKKTLTVKLPQERRGWFDVTFRLLDASRRKLLERNTSFAVLPKDTREATYQNSSFGTWCFGKSHKGTTVDKAGPLMFKAGIRRTLGSYGYKELKKYGLTMGQFPSLIGTHEIHKTSPEEIKKRFSSWPDTTEALIFHESVIGPIYTYPRFLVDKKPEPLDEKTEAELMQRFHLAVEASKAAKKINPDIKLVFGNMHHPAIEQYLSRNFPKEHIDSLGDESMGFMRMPERQPEYHALNRLWWLKKMAKYYGYENVGLAVSYEWMYHSTNPGNLSEREASDYNVRDSLLALAYGVPHVNPALAYDVGNAYYFSLWGASGLAHQPPELNPKPGYVSYATMTQMLDLAQFSQKLETGSTSLFALEFIKPDGSFVYTFWTIRGKRKVKLNLMENGTAVITDCMANQNKTETSEKQLYIDVNSSPLYVTGVQITSLEAGACRYKSHPAPDAVLLDPLDSLDEWTIDSKRNEDLEQYNWDIIRRIGRFGWGEKKDPQRGKVIHVAFKDHQRGPDVASYYGTLKPKKPISLPGVPKKIGLWVEGNSGWGRVIFELTDSEGETWTNIGAERMGIRPDESGYSPTLGKFRSPEDQAGKNTNDTESTSFINFDGWRYLSVQLPGQYPYDNYHWPRNCNWRHQGGDGLVDYPLRLTKLTIELREKLIYIDELVNATSRSININHLMCSY